MARYSANDFEKITPKEYIKTLSLIGFPFLFKIRNSVKSVLNLAPKITLSLTWFVEPVQIFSPFSVFPPRNLL